MILELSIEEHEGKDESYVWRLYTVASPY